MPYYFLQEDLEELDKRISEIRGRISYYREEKHLSVTQSSETYHDNYGFEESERQIKRLYGQLEELAEIKNKSEIVEPPKSNAKAAIGKKIKIKDIETGEEKEILLGSYMILKNGSAVSYESPLGKILLGAKKGSVKKGVINNKNVSLKITEIN